MTYTEQYTKVLMDIGKVDARLKELDYIGIKIAMGRATREEYAEQIAEAEDLAGRKNRLSEQIDKLWPLVAEEQNRLVSG